MLYDLVLAPEEDGDVELVYPGLLGLRQLELVEAEEARHLNPAAKPPVDGVGDLLLGVADPVHQWAAADEVVEVPLGRAERRGRGGRRGGARRRRSRWAVVRAWQERWPARRDKKLDHRRASFFCNRRRRREDYRPCAQSRSEDLK